MNKLVILIIFVCSFGSAVAMAGISGFQVKGFVHSFNEKSVVLYQKEAGLKITIPRNLVQQDNLKRKEKVTLELQSVKGVKTEKLKK